MIFFAETNVPAAVSGVWIWGFVGVATGLGAVLFAVNQGMKLVDRLRGKTHTPQPLAVEITKALHEQFAGKGDFDKHVTQNTERHGQLFRAIEKVEKAAADRLEIKFKEVVTEVHGNRDSNSKALNAQSETLRQHTEAVRRELSDKMDDMPDRIITTLKNTGAI